MTLLSASPLFENLGFWDICLRFLCAMVAGLIIGIEREYTHRPAGMRTHTLVALGSCAAMVVGQLLYAQYGGDSDPSRISAQVISGVGFLGAGTIMREGANVKGLTTAASIWSVAGLGLAAGAGYYGVAFIGTVLIIITLTIFEYLQNKFIKSYDNTLEYCVDAKSFSEALNTINSLADQYHCQISDIEAESREDGSCRIRFTVSFGRGNAERRKGKFFEGMVMDTSINNVRASDDPVASK